MNKDELLRRYIEGDLSPDEEKEALHTIADDPDMRSMLRFEQKLSDISFDELSSYENTKVPAGFSDRVMYRIAKKENIAREGIIQQVKKWYRKLWIPKQVQWRPVYAFAIALLVLFSLSYPLFITQNQNRASQNQTSNSDFNSSVQQVATSPDEVMLRFVFIDEQANSIAVAGDFNNWEPVELTSQNINGKQVWTGLISMSRGEHNYMFVRNGDEWVTDPLAPVQRDDGFGNKNAVIYL